MQHRAELNRRSFFRWTGGLCAAGLLNAAESQRRTIDVHHHVYPPAFVQALDKADQTTAAAKTWTPEHSLEDMDAAGVARAMISITTPGVSFAKGDADHRACD